MLNHEKKKLRKRTTFRRREISAVGSIGLLDDVNGKPATGWRQRLSADVSRSWYAASITTVNLERSERIADGVRTAFVHLTRHFENRRSTLS